MPPPTGFKATIAEYKEVASLFLRLGTLGFGGPAAHVSLMQRETVLKRGWLSREDFLDLLGAVNLMPGPSSSQMAIFLGFRRAGWVGLLLAGLCFEAVNHDRRRRVSPVAEGSDASPCGGFHAAHRRDPIR